MKNQKKSSSPGTSVEEQKVENKSNDISSKKPNKFNELLAENKDLKSYNIELRKENNILKREVESLAQQSLKNDILLSKGVKVKLTSKQYLITILAYLAGMSCLWYLIIK